MTELTEIRRLYANAAQPLDGPMPRPVLPLTRRAYRAAHALRRKDLATVLLHDCPDVDHVDLMVQTIAWLNIDTAWSTADCIAIRAAAEVEVSLAMLTLAHNHRSRAGR